MNINQFKQKILTQFFAKQTEKERKHKKVMINIPFYIKKKKKIFQRGNIFLPPVNDSFAQFLDFPAIRLK